MLKTLDLATLGLATLPEAPVGGPITEEQKRYADSGDYLAFWRSRWENNKDPVARTALLGWGEGISVNGSVIDKSSAAVAWINLGLWTTDAQFKEVSKELAKAHKDMINGEMKENYGPNQYLLDSGQANFYHHRVLKRVAGVGEYGFGGTIGGLPYGLTEMFWCRGCDRNDNDPNKWKVYDPLKRLIP